MSEEKIQIVATAQDKASTQLKGLRANISALGSRTGGPLGGLIGGFAGIPGPTLLAGAAIGAVTGFLGHAAGAAMEEQKNLVKLDAALKANVEGWDGNTDAIEASIAKREKLAFTDDELRDSLAQLVFVTKDVNKAMHLQTLAMDLARAKGMDLVTASELVAKVQTGNVAILKRYGIEVRKGATATEALASMQAQFSGQATAYAETTAGAMESAQIAIDDVVEDIGGMLLPAIKDVALFIRDDLIPAIDEIGDSFNDALINAPVDLFAEIITGTKGATAEMAEYNAMIDKLKDKYGEAAVDSATFTAQQKADIAAAGMNIKRLAVIYDTAFSDMAIDATREANRIGTQTTSALVQAAAEEARRQQANLAGIGAYIAGEVTDRYREHGIRMTRLATAEIIGNLADSIRGNREWVANAMDDIAFVMQNKYQHMAEVARIAGFLMSTKMANGLADGNPAIAGYFQHLYNEAADRYQRLTGLAWNAGRAAAHAYQRGLSQAELNVRDSDRYTGDWTPRSKPRGRRRAAGGPVSAGETYLVGESGPELLHMGRNSGSVTPNHAMQQPIRVVSVQELRRLLDEDQGRMLALAPSNSYSR